MKLIPFIAGATVGFCATMGALGSPSREVQGRAAMVGTGTAIVRVVTAGIAATVQRSGCGMSPSAERSADSDERSSFVKFDSCAVDTSHVQLRG